MFDRIYLPPGTAEQWDFENSTHHKRLIEIVSERDGFWCRICGSSASLSLHHIYPRGRTPKNLLIHDKASGRDFYRDDPANLCFLCLMPDHKILEGSGRENISCHDFVHQNTQWAEANHLLASP